MFDTSSADSIIDFSKKLKNLTLRKACGKEIEEHDYKGKGKFGQILEKFYFGYTPNSKSEPDFKEAGIELKSSPLKRLKNGELRSKERLVLNVINYSEVHKEDFNNSSFWKKNAHLLLVFYLFEKEINLLDYKIMLVDDWEYPKEDLAIIKHDWELISQKISEGRAHELSEGDTYYLGACTKGSSAKSSYKDQPCNKEQAKQRAYCLKQGYVNHIIANIAKEERGIYGKIIDRPEILENNSSIEEIVEFKFKPFYGKSANQIEGELGLSLNRNAKSYFANLTNAILGIGLGKKIEEFDKADIQVKTVRLKPNGLPKEDISFPTFKYDKLIQTDWEDSDFKNLLESKFFFVFYQFENDNLILRKVKFWNMPYADIIEAKNVWERMVEVISNGEIVKEIMKVGIRKTNFPKKTDNRISHVRPHAKNAEDTYKLPVTDKLTGVKAYTKHCFWLNASYVKDEIYSM